MGRDLSRSDQFFRWHGRITRVEPLRLDCSLKSMWVNAKMHSFASSTDLLLACSLANAACAIANIVTAPIFIIVSWLHAFFLVVVVVHSFLHILVVVVVNYYSQQTSDARLCCQWMKMIHWFYLKMEFEGEGDAGQHCHWTWIDVGLLFADKIILNEYRNTRFSIVQ